jgi:short-subunit dehydrogenase
MARPIAGRVIAITGASAGIGEALALRLAARGAKLALGARREERLEAVARACRERGAPDAIAWRTDVTSARDVELLLGAAVERLGGLDVLVNNAGTGHFDATTDLALERVREQLETNFISALHGVRAALPIMLAAGQGHIVFVTSVLQKRGIPFSAAYCAAKAALGSYAESLRVELRGSGIDVTTILPGATATEFHAVAGRGSGEARGPIGHVQKAGEVAATIERAIERPRPEVYTYRPHRGMAILNEVFPRVLDWGIARAFAGLLAGRRPAAETRG